MGKSAPTLGAWGEDLVAKHLGYRRQPGSGNRWPRNQDLIKEVRQPHVVGPGAARIEVIAHKSVAQVKTTRRADLVREWEALARYAEAESATPFWYIVIRTPQMAYILEQRLVKTIMLGIGGDE